MKNGKIKILFLFVVTALFLCSCGTIDLSKAKRIEGRINMLYGETLKLGPEQRETEIYEILLKGLQNFEERIQIKGVTGDELYDVYQKRMNREDIFWMNDFTVGEGQKFGFHAAYMDPEYLYSPEETEKMQAELSAAVDEITEKYESLGDFEKVKEVFDEILDFTEYAYEVADKPDEELTPEDMKAHTAYGCLVNHKAVCDGYTRALCVILNRLNVPCDYVHGKANDAAHAWNRIELEGEYYYLDATWGDQDKHRSYDYFNVNSAMLSVDHKIDESLDFPETEAMKYNYDVYNGTYISDGMELSEIGAVIEKQIPTGYARLRFETPETYSRAKDYFFDNGRIYDLPAYYDEYAAKKSISWYMKEDIRTWEIVFQ